mmetsp:Transcript_14218/g.33640  ORF Transcript_14218/g.33640 Transcript_14218/m.33640 type:complete len:371 (-) Transcript_14218:844-1956(-)
MLLLGLRGWRQGALVLGRVLRHHWGRRAELWGRGEAHPGRRREGGIARGRRHARRRGQGVGTGRVVAPLWRPQGSHGCLARHRQLLGSLRVGSLRVGREGLAGLHLRRRREALVCPRAARSRLLTLAAVGSPGRLLALACGTPLFDGLLHHRAHLLLRGAEDVGPGVGQDHDVPADLVVIGLCGSLDLGEHCLALVLPPRIDQADPHVLRHLVYGNELPGDGRHHVLGRVVRLALRRALVVLHHLDVLWRCVGHRGRRCDLRGLLHHLLLLLVHLHLHLGLVVLLVLVGLVGLRLAQSNYLLGRHRRRQLVVLRGVKLDRLDDHKVVPIDGGHGNPLGLFLIRNRLGFRFLVPFPLQPLEAALKDAVPVL